MQTRVYGKTGYHVSQLGFGAMRFPTKEEAKVDFDKAVEIIHKVIASGINFIDTHPMYCAGQSEVALGLGLEGADRSSLIIQDKNSTWKELEEGKSYRSRLEKSLETLKTDYIDFYLMHALSWDLFQKTGEQFLKEIRKAQDEGLVRHIGFSTHDGEDNVKKIIDTGNFECMLCQYNLIDLSNERMIDYASEKGLGVSVMGPLAGGRLFHPNEVVNDLNLDVNETAKTGLRFVLSNKNVSTAVSGMETVQQIEENVRIASGGMELSSEDRKEIEKVVREKKKLADLYCTGCGYCLPCPNNVAIPSCFLFMNHKRVYGLDKISKQNYKMLINNNQAADRCVECGICEEKCPQNIKIRQQLKQTHKELTS